MVKKILAPPKNPRPLPGRKFCLFPKISHYYFLEDYFFKVHK